MSTNDPVSDLLARIRNALLAKHDRLELPASKIKQEVCRILDEQGYIESVERIDGTPQDTLRIFLRYDRAGTPAITRMTRESKPGRRVYRSASDLPTIKNGLGTAIVSTSQGLLTDSEARERRLGGEILCEIW
jgi:small subunit ribosomal protein S8